MQFNVSMNKDSIGQKADLFPIDGIANPIVGPTVTTAANGASPLAFTTYYVGYSWVNGRGQTLVSPLTPIVLTVASNIVVTLPALPAGATSANIYISQVASILLLQGSTATTTYTQSVALVAGASSSLTNETYNWGTSIGLGDGQGNLQTMLGNVQGTLLPSAARTATISTPDQINVNGDGVHVILDVTAVGTGSVTLAIEAKDPVSGKYYPLLTGAAVVTNVTNVYKVFPGLAAAANSVANDFLPRTWRVTVTANNVNPATYSVGYMINS